MPLVCALLVLTVGGAVAQDFDVALVRPTQYLVDHPAAATGDAHTYLQAARDILDAAGIRHHTVEEGALTGGKFPTGEFLLCAYNPDMPAGVAAAISGLLDRGGQALLCYFCPDAIRSRLGLGELVYTPAGAAGLFRSLAATPLAPPGTPARVRQDSWNAYIPGSTDPARGRVLMEWLAADGRTRSGPALVADDRVAWLGHVITPGDVTAKACLLLALIGRAQPAIWDRALDVALRPRCGFRYAADIPGLVRLARGRPSERAVRYTANALQAVRDRRGHRPPWELYRRAVQLRARLADLYVGSLPARRDALRGAWVVMPEGVGGWGWEKTARVARENGLTDLFVRVEWGGRTAYPSEVLPSRLEAGQPDPVAEGIAACHRHGLRYHAWFINLNWRMPTDSIVAEMSRRGFWQISPQGEERVDEGGEMVRWLNPSEPGVVALQAQMMAEMARKYPVDGVHFDYIRYENYSGSYGPRDRERFEQWAGVRAGKWPGDVLSAAGKQAAGPLHEKYCEWRCEQVSAVVKACAEASRAARSGCKVSASVYPSWPAHRKMVGQDWARWLREGWLDFVCPMAYDAPSYFDRHVDRVKRLREAAGDHPLYVGLGAWLHPTPVTVAESIVADRELGADGFLLFSFTPELGERFLPALRRGVFGEAAR